MKRTIAVRTLAALFGATSFLSAQTWVSYNDYGKIVISNDLEGSLAAYEADLAAFTGNFSLPATQTLFEDDFNSYATGANAFKFPSTSYPSTADLNGLKIHSKMAPVAMNPEYGRDFGGLLAEEGIAGEDNFGTPHLLSEGNMEFVPTGSPAGTPYADQTKFYGFTFLIDDWALDAASYFTINNEYAFPYSGPPGLNVGEIYRVYYVAEDDLFGRLFAFEFSNTDLQYIWRMDDLRIDGIPGTVPEPSSAFLLGIAGSLALTFRRRGNK